MELLARERAAEQNVQYYLKNTEEPVVKLLQAFEEYRHACQSVIFANFEDEADRKGRVLWHTHTQGKKFFHDALSGLRKQPGDKSVALRQLVKFYLQFIKDSQRFYRDFIHQLSVTFGGIPALEAVAHQVKSESLGESPQAIASPALQAKVLQSCHQSLICLGDLSRYRASEQLDKNPDFGPAVGYYGLACTLLPSSGMGHHQLAVVALEQRNHLRAIYHLYRAMVVEDPHPNAATNLKREFVKTNSAWDRGELIPKGSPNQSDASKRTLVGWFVRLHSISFNGEPFRGYNELENEILGQLAFETKQRSLDSTLVRMVMVNLAAQYNAGEIFQQNPIEQNQHAFLQFFRINTKTFTTLLRVFYEDLRTIDLSTVEDDDDGLAARISVTARGILPALRLYSSWLLTVINLLGGLSNDATLKEPIDQFWHMYARTIDMVSVVFPIWDLDAITELPYLLEEDADTVGFKPLVHDRTNKVWRSKVSGLAKPRFSEQGVVQLSADEEMLVRVKEFLVDGLFLANDEDDAPIKLRGTRILHRDAQDPDVFPKTAPKPKQVVGKPENEPATKPLSYAAAAANGKPSAPVIHSAQANGPRQPPSSSQQANGVAAPAPGLSRHDQLSRMVDDLVDEDDNNDPMTPPQPHTTHPAVVSKSDVSYSSRSIGQPDRMSTPNYAYPNKQAPIGTPGGVSPPPVRTPQTTAAPGTPLNRLQSLSGLWNEAQQQQQQQQPLSSFPPGLTIGTLASPAQLHDHRHSRVNSAGSNRSQGSQGMNAGIAQSPWSPSQSVLQSTAPPGLAPGFSGGVASLESPANVSPLLFGAGGSVWSRQPVVGGRNATPPRGQGG